MRALLFPPMRGIINRCSTITTPANISPSTSRKRWARNSLRGVNRCAKVFAAPLVILCDAWASIHPLVRKTMIASALAVLTSGAPLSAQEPFDLVIRNGKVVDGTGNPWFYADVAILNGKIVRVG